MAQWMKISTNMETATYFSIMGVNMWVTLNMEVLLGMAVITMEINQLNQDIGRKANYFEKFQMNKKECLELNILLIITQDK